MVHLLGVNHSFQLCAIRPFREGGLDNSASAPVAAALEAYILKLVDRLCIRTIAEEYSAERLHGQLQTDEMAYLVAKTVCETRPNLRHVFCDPNRRERESMYAAAGVSEAEDASRGFPIREAKWLRRLEPHLPRGETLFLCGALHVVSFLQRLSDAGVESAVACEDFGAKYSGSS